MTSIWSTTKKALVYFVVVIILLLFLFPIYWLIRTGGLEEYQIFSLQTYWFPVRLFNFINIWRLPGLPNAYLHSVIVSVSATGLTVLLALPVSFSLARLSTTKSARSFLDSLLIALALPPVVLLVPFYILMSHLGLVDNLLALVIIDMVFNLPFSVWLIYSFVREIPLEIEESGLIDGCSRLEAFLKLSVPLCVGGLAVAAILGFIALWNELLFAMTLTQRYAVTAPVSILDLVLGRGGGGMAPAWDMSSAAGVWFMAPNIIFGLIMNKYLIKALTLGAVKE